MNAFSGLVVAMGSASDVKARAVRAAMPGCTVVSDPGCQSGVSEQPVGRGETERGAANRAHAALGRHPGCSLWVGIENGIMVENGSWVDRACIVALGKSGERVVEVVAWSDEVRVPAGAVKGPVAEDGPRHLWSPKKDPHLEVCGRSRVDFIADALRSHVVPHIAELCRW
eukprot:m51a1_g488 hypothetical protein (170) ;mRNA; r:229032-229714